MHRGKRKGAALPHPIGDGKGGGGGKWGSNHLLTVLKPNGGYSTAGRFWEGVI